MTISPLLTFNMKVGFTFSVLSPKACPYVVMRFAPSLIVADMNHRILLRLTRIQRDSTRRIFVGICGDLWFGFKTTNLHESHEYFFVESVRLFLLNLVESV